MKRLLMCTAAIACVTTAASAADLYIEQPPLAPVVVQNTFDWTGFYAGVMGGYGGDEFNYPFDFDEEFEGEASISSSGFFAGGQLGYNWQYNQWVFGLETDIAWADIDGELEFSLDEPDNLNASAGSTVEWFGTTRLRAGFLATPRLLLYGTGGFAYGSVEHSYDLSDLGAGSDSTSETQTGWAAGAGFEYAVTDHITLKTEYLFVDLGEETLLEDDGFSIDAETQFHTVKAGLNFLW